jgi:hypothetical protein
MVNHAPVSATVWAVTAGIAALVIAADMVWAFARRDRQTTVRESIAWTTFYITAAIGFGFFLGGSRLGLPSIHYQSIISLFSSSFSPNFESQKSDSNWSSCLESSLHWSCESSFSLLRLKQSRDLSGCSSSLARF